MERLDLNGRTSGKIKVYCPLCRDGRKNKRDKSVSVDLDRGFAKCHYCGECFFTKSSHHRLPSGSKPLHPGSPCGNDSPPFRGGVPEGGSGGYQDNYQGSSQTALTKEHVDWFRTERGISKETLEKLGVSSKEEYMPQTGKKEWCICFNYYKDGKLVNTKFRDLQKNFKMVSGAEVIPYNIDGIKGTKQCIIAEGEIDGLSFAEIGRMDVISVPTGANTNLAWMDKFVETHLEDKEVIYIAVDNDRKGLELQKELIRRLGAHRCRIVNYPEGCKDANEVLCLQLGQDSSHHPGFQPPLLGQEGSCDAAGSETLHPGYHAASKLGSGILPHGAEVLKKCLEEAHEVPLEGVFTIRDIAAELRLLFEKGMERGAKTGWANFDELCTFELGRLCVVTGIPGAGKSEFVDELVMRLNIRHGWKAAYFSPENTPLAYHIRKLMEKVTGVRFKEGCMTEKDYVAAEHYLAENYSFILPKDNFTVENVLETAEELVRRKGIKTLTIDPFNRFEHQIPNGQTETQYISAVLDKFTNFAVRNNCLVILVAHPRKMYKEPGSKKEPVPGLYDINGSAAFYNKSDFGLTVDRDYEAGATRVYIQKVKFRHLGEKGEATFMYNTVNGRYAPCQIDEQTGKAWRGLFDNEGWE